MNVIPVVSLRYNIIDMILVYTYLHTYFIRIDICTHFKQYQLKKNTV